MIAPLETIRREFNAGAKGAKKISLADGFRNHLRQGLEPNAAELLIDG